MARIYKKRSGSVKAKIALEAIKEKKTLTELSQEYGVAVAQISTWKKQLEDECNKIFEGSQKKDQQGEIDRLHRVLGQITAERNFLERALNH
jgi:transposase